MKQQQRYGNRKQLGAAAACVGCRCLSGRIVASKVHSFAARRATVGCEWWGG